MPCHFVKTCLLFSFFSRVMGFCFLFISESFKPCTPYRRTLFFPLTKYEMANDMIALPGMANGGRNTKTKRLAGIQKSSSVCSAFPCSSSWWWNHVKGKELPFPDLFFQMCKLFHISYLCVSCLPLSPRSSSQSDQLYDMSRNHLRTYDINMSKGGVLCICSRALHFFSCSGSTIGFQLQI